MRGHFDMSNVGDENGGEAIKLTSTLKSSPDGGGAAEVLQAALNSSNDSSEASRRNDMNDEGAPVADGESETPAASAGERFGWWNLLELATLQRNTEEFYSPKQRSFSAGDRWIRLEKKLAKVGRGLSKDEKALKLGCNIGWKRSIRSIAMDIIYAFTLKSGSRVELMNHFITGKEIDLEQCSRSKLQSELVEYLGPVLAESDEEVAKRAPGKNGDLAPVNNDNEIAFAALLASAGFTIRSDTNSRFTKSDSESGQEDIFDRGSVDEEDKDYDLVLKVEKSSGSDGARV